eukprot:GHVU01146644.1.p1 GENE.GHVU01146644.1~~GHVU01146644.1.p1  ORF type:complete len:112 (-),score=9.74 GHVU01146644.1:304-639(-)
MHTSKCCLSRPMFVAKLWMMENVEESYALWKLSDIGYALGDDHPLPKSKRLVITKDNNNDLHGSTVDDLDVLHLWRALMISKETLLPKLLSALKTSSRSVLSRSYTGDDPF